MVRVVAFILKAYDTELAEKIVMMVTESPYRVAVETISNSCGVCDNCSLLVSLGSSNFVEKLCDSWV